MQATVESGSESVTCHQCDDGCEHCDSGKRNPQEWIAVGLPSGTVRQLADAIDGIADGMFVCGGLLLTFAGVTTADIRERFERLHERLANHHDKWARRLAEQVLEQASVDEQFAKNWTADGLLPPG